MQVQIRDSIDNAVARLQLFLATSDHSVSGVASESVVRIIRTQRIGNSLFRPEFNGTFTSTPDGCTVRGTFRLSHRASRSKRKSSHGWRIRAVKMRRAVRFAVLLAAFGCGFALAAEEKIGVSVGSTGSTDSRPLSEGWLEYWLKAPMTPFADRTILQLASELTESKSVVSDSWSQRTEAEIHSAISSDNLLANNAWSTVRCSKNGCLAAIQSLDTKVYDRQRTYKGRLLAYLTPRVTNSNQVDLTTVESDRNGNYLKSIEMGRSMVDYGVAQSEDLAIVSESYFALRDCKYAVIWADKSIASSKARGESPRSSSLNVKSDCNRFFEAAKQHGDAEKSIVAF